MGSKYDVINPTQCENKSDLRNLSLKKGSSNKDDMEAFHMNSKSPKNDGAHGTSIVRGY